VRTTLTIDDDLAGILRRRSREMGKSFKEIVNMALRKGLTEESSAAPCDVTVRPHDFGRPPGLDRLSQLADDLEIEDYLRKAAKDDSARH